MVSFNVYRATSSGAYIEGVCLASDEKPITGIANGSILYAVDASDGSTTRYMFDQSTASWIEAECPCSGGGSGSGSGGGGALIVHAYWSEADDGPVGPLDASFNQIKAARDAGRPVLLYGEPDTESIDQYYYSYPLVVMAATQVDETQTSYVAIFKAEAGYNSEFYATDPDAPMSTDSGGGPS